MRVIAKDGYIPGFAIFYELTDEQLERVRNNKDLLTIPKSMNEFKESKGDNAHFFGLVSDTQDRFRIIYRQAKMLLKNYKTISWWDREQDKFIIIGRD